MNVEPEHANQYLTSETSGYNTDQYDKMRP